MDYERRRYCICLAQFFAPFTTSHENKRVRSMSWTQEQIIQEQANKRIVDDAKHQEGVKIHVNERVRSALWTEQGAATKLVESPDEVQGVPTGYSHDMWVRDGNCPVISLTKAWCSKAVGHEGSHYSPRIPNPNLPIGPGNHAYAEWDH